QPGHRGRGRDPVADPVARSAHRSSIGQWHAVDDSNRRGRLLFLSGPGHLFLCLTNQGSFFLHEVNMMSEIWPDDSEQEKSKSQLKREMHELQAIGQQLLDLKEQQLAAFPLTED